MGRSFKQRLFCSTAIVMGLFWLGASPASAATCGPGGTGKTLDELLLPGSSIAANGLEFSNWGLDEFSSDVPAPSDICVYPLEDDPDTTDAYDPGLGFMAAWSGNNYPWTMFLFEVETKDANEAIKGITFTLTDFEVDPDAGGVVVAQDVYGDALLTDGIVSVEAYDYAPSVSVEFADLPQPVEPQKILYIQKIAIAWQSSVEGQVVLRQFEQRFSLTDGNPGYVEVPVDIKPWGCKNRFNVKRKRGTVWVGILGTEDLDVTQINPASVMLEGVLASRWKYKDVTRPVERKGCDLDCTNGRRDKHQDLILKFKRRDLIKTLGDVEHKGFYGLELTGEMYDGTPIKGYDSVYILNKPKNKKKKWRHLNTP